jgi:hypothetical protein
MCSLDVHNAVSWWGVISVFGDRGKERILRGGTKGVKREKERKRLWTVASLYVVMPTTDWGV